MRDVLVSAATSGAVMISTVVATGLLAGGLGPAGFGVYGLSRRLLSVVSAISPGPVGVALARSMALATDERKRGTTFCAAALLALVPNLLLLAAGLAFPAFWARLLLSDARFAPELTATLALILATTIYSVVFARLRGTSDIGQANLWQLWVMGLGPVIVAGALASRGQVRPVIVALAAASSLAVAPLLHWVVGALRSRIRWAEVRAPLLELMAYVVPRIPGAAAFAALLAIGPFLAPYFGSLTEAGYLVAGQSVLRIVEGGTAGFGLVALPKVASLHARKEPGFLRDRVEDLVGLVVHMGLFAACQLTIWSPEIIRAWLGAEYEAAVPIIQVLLVALVPYLGYTMLRSIIDGIEVRPVNTRNLYAALAVAATLSLALGGAGYGSLGLAIANAAGLFVLGGLTVGFLRARLGFSGTHVAIGSAIALNLAAAGLALGARALLVSRLEAAGLVLALLALTLLLLTAYLMALRQLRVRWLLQVEVRLMGRGGAA
jgi:O-antigen/teichoic acid export membrane protein